MHGDTLRQPSGREVPQTDSGGGLRRDQPTVEQRRKPGAQTPLAKLRKHQRHIIVRSRDAAADAQRAVERLFDEPRHLGVIGG